MIAAPRPSPPRPSSGPPDAELLSRVSNGDMGALGALFDRYEADVRRVVIRLGVREGDADDLVQATFLDVLARASTYDGRASARPWVIGLAVIHVKRQRRSFARLAARLARWATEPTESPEQPDHRAEQGELSRRAQAALDALSAKKREVFVLTVLEGLSGEEVASTLDIPVATVWTRLHHARRELREALSLEEA